MRLSIPGIQRVPDMAMANPVETLLSSATGWWDAGDYVSGERFLRNRGQAGQSLDMRLGSSTIVNTNEPKFVCPDDIGSVYMPGVSGNGLTVPFDSSMNMDDIDIRFYWKRSWSNAYGIDSQDSTLAHRWQNSTATKSWKLEHGGTGRGLTFHWIDSLQAAQYCQITFRDVPDRVWGRFTFDADNGSGQYEGKLYSSEDGISWSQIGSTMTGTATTIQDTSVPFIIAGYSWPDSSGTYHPAGYHYRTVLMNSIDGSPLIDIDCDVIRSGSQTSFVARTGQTVTISRKTSGYRSTALPAKRYGGKPLFLFGIDDYLETLSDRIGPDFNVGGSMSMIVVGRQWGNPTDHGGWLSHLNSAGYEILMRNDAKPRIAIYDTAGRGADTITGMSPVTYGEINVLSGVRDTRTRTFRGYNGKSYYEVADPTSDLTEPRTVRIGSRTSGTAAEFEFMAAAIFRRALTADEIAEIVSFYQSRIGP